MRRLAFSITVVVFGASFVEARDLGQYSQITPEMRQWFNSLYNKNKQLCCTDADGYDAQWDTKEGKYRVFDQTQGWVTVPDEAVVETPNKAGVAKVWWYVDKGERKIRCFLRGAQG